MMFTTPLGLLALLAIPAIVTIHLFRRRFPVRPVAGLFLWQIVRQTPEGGGKVTKLPITTSLILECLAALALALILAGARLSSADVSQHLVVLLDDSASMAASNARGESPRDRAVRRVLGEVDRLGSGARITLVRSGDRPSVLAGPAALAVEAQPALERWNPEATHHSFALGLRLARELAGRTGQLMVVSDVTPASRGEGDVEGALWVSVGEPLANVGITAAQRTLSPASGSGAVSLTLGNYSDAPAHRQLTLWADDKNVWDAEKSTCHLERLRSPCRFQPGYRPCGSGSRTTRCGATMRSFLRSRARRRWVWRTSCAKAGQAGALEGARRPLGRDASGIRAPGLRRCGRAGSIGNAWRVACGLRTRAGSTGRRGRLEGFRRSVRVGKASSAASWSDAGRCGVAGRGPPCRRCGTSAGLRGR